MSIQAKPSGTEFKLFENGGLGSARKGGVRDGREKARFDYQAAVVGRV